MSWSGRGIDDESRERVIATARRSGLSVSELVRAMSEEPVSRGAREGVSRGRRPARADESVADIDRQLDRLSDRLRRLGRDDIDGPAPRGRAPRRETPDRDDRSAAVLDEIAATVERLNRSAGDERAPRRAPAAPTRRAPMVDDREQQGFDEILSALDGLDRRIRTLSEDRGSPTEGARDRRTRAAVGDLDRAISDITDRQGDLDRRRAAPRFATDLDRRFRELGDKIDLIRSADGESRSAELMAEIRGLRELIERRATVGADVSEEIRRLAVKLDELAASHPRLDTLEPLMTEVGRLRDVVLQSNVEGSLKSIEAGYGHIVDRLDDLKRGLASPRVGAKVDAEISEIHNLLRAVPQVTQFAAIERSFRDLAEKVDHIAAREETRPASDLDRRIAELKVQIDGIDPSNAVRALDKRLKAVTDKLDAIENVARGPVATDHMAALVDELRTVAAGSGSNEELRALERRIAELGERIADFDRRRPTFDDTDRLHERLAELSDKIERFSNPTTDRRTVETLEAMIGRLDELAARPTPALAPAGSAIEPRLAALVDRLEKSGARPDRTSDLDALTSEIAAMRRDLSSARPGGDLEAQMRLLAERLEKTSTHEPDDEALAQIEEQLGRISSQLATTESRFQSVAALQAGIERLGDRLEATHSEAIDAARQAAREMMREIASGGASGGGIPEAVIRALHDDLKSLQSAARETEHRTADTLVSLHDALTGIVGRLTTIEKIAQGSARSAAAKAAGAASPEAPRAAAEDAPRPFAAAAQPAPQVRPAPGFDAPPALSVPPAPPVPPVAVAPPVDVPPAATIAGRPASAASAVARAREMLTSSAEDSRPLEPGSGKPSVRPQAPSAAPSVSTVAPPPLLDAASPVAPASEAAAGRKADFIAAARRAAQAAAGGAPLAAQPEDRASAPLPIGGDDGADEAGSGPLARIGRILKNKRRPLVLATAAVVLALLTLQIFSGGDDRQAAMPAPPPPPKVESNAAPVLPPKTSVRLVPPAFDPQGGGNAVAPTNSTSPTTTASIPPAGSPTPPPRVAQTVAPSEDASHQTSAMAPQPAPQQSAGLVAPTPDASMLAPETTGAIPREAATAAPAAAAMPALPAQIGSETLRRAAESGDPRAAFEIGMRYAEGRGVTADARQAFTWYRHAADKGLVPALYRVAVAHEKGLGTERNADEAKRAYTAAAEKGNIRAMHNLGVLFANGRDMNAAIPWFQKAADLGLKDSQFNLGIIHALGSGVKQDLAISYKWFALAARQGDKEAEKKQNEVGSHLDKTSLAAAKMAVQTWVQRPLDRAANDEVEIWKEAAGAKAQPSQADVVARLQNLLKANGVYSGPINGEMTGATRTAVKSFQKKAGLPQTGEPDQNLFKALAGKAM